MFHFFHGILRTYKTLYEGMKAFVINQLISWCIVCVWISTMPMPIRYEMRKQRPKEFLALCGSAYLNNKVFIQGDHTGSEFAAYIQGGARVGDCIGYFAPNARLYLSMDHIPTMRFMKMESVTVFEHNKTKECLMVTGDTDCHFSMFMLFTDDPNCANAVLTPSTAICMTQDLSYNPQKIVCFIDPELWTKHVAQNIPQVRERISNEQRRNTHTTDLHAIHNSRIASYQMNFPLHNPPTIVHHQPPSTGYSPPLYLH